MQHYRFVFALLVGLSGSTVWADEPSAGEAFETLFSQIEVLEPEAFLAEAQACYATHQQAAPVTAAIAEYALNQGADDVAGASKLAARGLALFPESTQLKSLVQAFRSVGTPAPLAGPLLDGSAFDITDLQGQVVVIDFWATWCGPCTSMTPSLKALYQKYRNRGVQFVGVSLDHSVDPLKRYVASHGIAWPQIYHTTRSGRSKATSDYGVSTIPALFVVGKDGNLASLRLNSTGQVERAIVSALAK